MVYNYLPLFPLDVVICPGGMISLKIFETRYMDMVRACIKNNSMFVIVAVLPDGVTDSDGYLSFAHIGTTVKIVDGDVDVDTTGLMMIQCVGINRVKVESFYQQPDGLVIGVIEDIPNDLPMSIPKDLEFSKQKLIQLLESWNQNNIVTVPKPVSEPYYYESASWVANRWVELLDLPLLEKQRLMQLDCSITRLELIQDILEEN